MGLYYYLQIYVRGQNCVNGKYYVALTILLLTMFWMTLPSLILRLWQFGGLECQAVKHDHHYNYLYQDHHYHYHCDHLQGSMGGLGWEAELWDAWPQLSNHSLHSVAWLQRWILFSDHLCIHFHSFKMNQLS